MLLKGAEMISKKVIITDEKGLHMRPAKDLSQIAIGSSSKVRIIYNGSEYNAKSLISMLGAGVKSGGEIEIVCDGDDEEQILNEMLNYILNN